MPAEVMTTVVPVAGLAFALVAELEVVLGRQDISSAATTDIVVVEFLIIFLPINLVLPFKLSSSIIILKTMNQFF